MNVFTYQIKHRLAAVAAIVGSCFAGVPMASAATIIGNDCMQMTYSGPKVNGSNMLNCTANDIAIAKAVSASPSSCLDGTMVDLTATFQVNVNASQRYDAGFYFRVDGGPDARGPAGTCSLTTLAVPPPSGAPWKNLDNDYCGDFQAAGSVNVTIHVGNVLCHDANGTGFLSLPNCTAWHSNASTLCNTETDAVPETKSKCKCDDTFQVPVRVEQPTGTVFKSATNSVVTYEAKVKNSSTTRTVKINSLIDNIYGNLATCAGSTCISTTCGSLIGNTLAPGATSNACSFTVSYPNPGTAGDLTDTITAELQDTSNGTKVTVNGSATINVNLNVAP